MNRMLPRTTNAAEGLPRRSLTVTGYRNIGDHGPDARLIPQLEPELAVTPSELELH